MRVLLVFFVLFSTILTGWSQQNMYILYDPTCMDRLKYESFGTLDNSDYISYAVKLSETERLFLEIGAESADMKPRIPGNIKACSSPDLNKNLAIQINSGAVQAYTVRKTSNGYLISPVQKASYLQTVGNTISYMTQQYSFQYDPARNSINENLAPRTADIRIYYVGKTSYNCLEAYLFQAVPQYSTASYSDLIFIPEIGVIEDRASSSSRSNSNVSLQLGTVNGTGFPAAYLSDFCARRNNPNLATNNDTTPNTNPTNPNIDPNTTAAQIGNVADTGLENSTTSYDSNATNRNRLNTNNNYGLIYPKDQSRPEEFSDRGISQSNTVASTNDPCVDRPNDGVHVVSKGENLFRISKNNDITVQQIKSWNGLSSNLIYPCDKLWVVPPSEYNKVAGEFASRGNANFVQEYHIVQPDETLLEIAEKYGYTVERFREFNNLRPDEFIYVGQRLKANDCKCPTTETQPQQMNAVNNTQRLTSDFQTRGGAVTTSQDQPESYERNVSLQPKIHIVQEDETIYSIAQQYNTTVSQLKRLNNLDDSEVLLPFQRIYVR